MEARSSNRRRKGKQGLARLAAFTFHFDLANESGTSVGVIVTAE